MVSEMLWWLGRFSASYNCISLDHGKLLRISQLGHECLQSHFVIERCVEPWLSSSGTRHQARDEDDARNGRHFDQVRADPGSKTLTARYDCLKTP